MIGALFAAENMTVASGYGYDCEACKDKTNATRTQTLTGTAPASIIVQLKRFMFNRGAGSARKIFAEVSGLGSFTLNFESSDRTMTKERYLLRAVIDHVGDSQDRGHYISYARRNIHHAEAGDARLEWFKFDDSAFTQVLQPMFSALCATLREAHLKPPTSFYTKENEAPPLLLRPLRRCRSDSSTGSNCRIYRLILRGRLLAL